SFIAKIQTGTNACGLRQRFEGGPALTRGERGSESPGLRQESVAQILLCLVFRLSRRAQCFAYLVVAPPERKGDASDGNKQCRRQRGGDRIAANPLIGALGGGYRTSQNRFAVQPAAQVLRQCPSGAVTTRWFLGETFNADYFQIPGNGW